MGGRFPSESVAVFIGMRKLDNNTAERSMRAIALGRKNYLFMGSERGG